MQQICASRQLWRTEISNISRLAYWTKELSKLSEKGKDLYPTISRSSWTEDYRLMLDKSKGVLLTGSSDIKVEGAWGIKQRQDCQAYHVGSIKTIKFMLGIPANALI